MSLIEPNEEIVIEPLFTHVLITGGRIETDWRMVYNFLDANRKKFAPSFCVIQGGARGIDSFAKSWAHREGACCITVDANWDKFQGAAGPIRNSWMLQFIPVDLCIVFPGGRGTLDMKQRALADKGIEVWEVDPFIWRNK